MKIFATATVCFIALSSFSFAADAAEKKTETAGLAAPSFTVKGKEGMEVRLVLMPRECIKINKKKRTAALTSCSTTKAEPIALTLGEPLKLGDEPHTFDLVEGIRVYTTNIGTQQYPINLFGGVCVYLQGGNTPPKCGIIGGAVQL
jgi:hypothetical protein